MYTKEEIKQIRIDFWDGFQKYSSPKRRKLGKPKKWMMQNTGIKAVDLKFHIDHSTATVGIDVVSKSLDKKVAYWNRLLGLKNLLQSEFEQEFLWNDMYVLESGKEIIRIALVLEDVNILNRETWPKVYAFFFENMMKLEDWLEEYKEVVRVREV